ncbi:hypothetical protein PENSTE_c002G10448 [Penicillium steckii]|uniref:ubiquitinyl hydrolase 1 n=1 Tax=Penicillium steckii TaxID=303698 RepID=A0A1V6TUL8_9EURO|nr:hypothetical protein PENSTE_c002G10448 [Penicillium steckii]
MTSSSERLSLAESLYFFHHVFLPSKLPQSSDYDPQLENRLLDEIVCALQMFEAYLSGRQLAAARTVISGMSRLRDVIDFNGHLSEAELKKALFNLDTEDAILPIMVHEQNAGMLISSKSDGIHVEAFELSPPCETVIDTLGRVRRTFPGSGIAIDLDIFQDSALQVVMSQTLAKMSHQPAPGTKVKVKKAGQYHDEDRDVTNPMMITEFFTSFLRPLGVDIADRQVNKNTRDEVMWMDSLLPWRRSSLWLFVRVVLHLLFRRCSEPEETDDLYKHIMIFLMGSILEKCHQGLTCETIHLMTAKIGRRLLKLDLTEEPAWIVTIQATLVRTSKRVQVEWQSIQQNERNDIDISTLAIQNLNGDIYCALPQLDQHLEEIRLRAQEPFQGVVGFLPLSRLLEFSPNHLPGNPDFGNDEYLVPNLAAFEGWVESNLDDWLDSRKADVSTCRSITEMMLNYYDFAYPVYSMNPEALSLMILTVIELWIACDKSATHNIHMLRDYDVCIPIGLLYSLVLPLRSQLVRLARVEKYLRDRQERSQYHGSGIFNEFGTEHCFSVRYFNQSKAMQSVYEAITKRASETRAQKRAELHQKQENYKNLMNMASQTACKYDDVLVGQNGFHESRHSPRCQRCQLKSNADSISIAVHEWPLSSCELKAKSTIFELRPPESFSYWRDCTIILLLDVLQMNYKTTQKPRATYYPHTYSGLSEFTSPALNDSRVGILSENKPHTGTHRRNKVITSVTQDEICVNNGLNFRYFDNVQSTFVVKLINTYNVPRACMYKLPESSSTLQRFLFKPAEDSDGPPPNTVIASQGCAPLGMGLAEYRALSTLPLGSRIQWQNIMIQLFAPSVDFKKIETAIFILQIINQTGPSHRDSLSRQGHRVLEDYKFTARLLSGIESAAGRMEENWEMAQGLCALVFLAQRVHALSPSSTIQKFCLECLKYLREISFRWLNTVTDQANRELEEQNKSSLIGKAVHIAFVCIETFNIQVLDEIFQDPLNVSIFIQCSMAIRDSWRASSNDSDQLIQILYHRWRALTYRSHRTLANRIVNHKSPGLNMAIEGVWSAFPKGAIWTRIDTRIEHWLVACAPNRPDYSLGMFIHFNLLTGEFLVNGLPMSRLPTHYEHHQTYSDLFGMSRLEVMPSNVSGLHFSVRKEYIGHIVHLGKRDGLAPSDLSVLAIKDGKNWEFIPRRIFETFFPDDFVQHHCVWYNVDDGYVELRPSNDPWVSSDSNWILRKNPFQKTWCLEKNESYMLNLRSQTVGRIAKILQPIEKHTKLHCVFHTLTSTMSISLPRLQLEFALHPGESASVMSREYPGMLIDQDQSLESLIGFENKLLLIYPNTQDRVLLIPEGRAYSTSVGSQVGNHYKTSIEWQSTTKVHSYTIDEDLGRIIDNGSLQSKLFLAYLHALTSFCLPDPLTRKTGTEQALTILRSASMRSLDKLQPENCTILADIAALAPTRTYYPANEKVMQSVKWRWDLSSLSQHSAFYTEVEAIFDQDRRMRVFYPERKLEHPELLRMSKSLLKRDLVRSSSFRVSGFGAEEHTTQYDKVYIGRSRSSKPSQVFSLCKMIYDGMPRTQEASAEHTVSKVWEMFTKFDRIEGYDHGIDSVSLKYDATFLLDPEPLVVGNWFGIYRLVSTRALNEFQFATWLSTMAFSERIDYLVLELIASFWIDSRYASCSPPTEPMFLPDQGCKIDLTILRSKVQSRPISQTPQGNLKISPHETYGKFAKRISHDYQTNISLATKDLVNHLKKQWPCRLPSLPGANTTRSFKFEDYISMDETMTAVREQFTIWSTNIDLHGYLHRLAVIFTNQPARHIRYVPPPTLPMPRPTSRKSGFLRFDDLIRMPLILDDMKKPVMQDALCINAVGQIPLLQLAMLVKSLRSQAKTLYEGWYVEKLQQSVMSLQNRTEKSSIKLESEGPKLEDIVMKYLSSCQEYHDELRNVLMLHLISPRWKAGSLGPRKIVALKLIGVLSDLNHLPRISPCLILEQLARHRWSELDRFWKDTILMYGESVTILQRARRMASLLDQPEELMKELQNPGHTNWDPFEFPESLLLEIENGILIREVQEQIAQVMRCPTPGKNIVMQLNMGEGKSSVILPIVASAMANGSCLIRVVVMKPQSRQMFHMLVSKIGSLLNRRVYHMPISRYLKLSVTDAREIERMCRECMLEGGVLLVQPEHILSLKLMCLESFISGKPDVGKALLRVLHFFDTYSCDIVDESDESFNTKFELIYTMGAQSPVDFSPQRWVLIQEVLDLVIKYAPEVQASFPRSIEVDHHAPGAVPRIRILDRHAEEALLRLIARHVCEIGVDSFPIARQPEVVRDAILLYLTKQDPSAEEITAVENQNGSTEGFWTDTTRSSLLLLRGLLARSVLAFCFREKRWRVNFGPDPNRSPPTKLCVPYRAKDNPSLRSEFSHPDVVIILTCLNYYYAGLSDDDLFLAFADLQKADQADIDYQVWISDSPNLPNAYRQIMGVNLEDRYHCIKEIFPALRFSKAVVDYFLGHIVFPREIRAFPQKLSASGWDIGETKSHPMTGFSGTNDSQKSLPLSVHQLDLPEQSHTNALVLQNLLHTKNSVASIPNRDNSSTGISDAQHLLNMVCALDPPIQVILDVGAQILELDNLRVAKRWLEMLPNDGTIKAVIYISDNDEISVVDRTGRVEPLQISPFARQMEACYVFLDEAHTRGIDLKLPLGYRAAVTLGAGMTKDKLAQACMRMRKLGSGHSVTFCVPKEIEYKILDLGKKDKGSSIDKMGVLCWAISQTWAENKRTMPLWAVQGRRFERQSNLWRGFRQRTSLDITSEEAQSFLESEFESLEERYRPNHHHGPDYLKKPSVGETGQLALISERCREFGDTDSTSPSLNEEQEREIAPEIEREREIERPPAADCQIHAIHPDVRSFIVTGLLNRSSMAFQPAFQSLSQTSAASFLSLLELPTRLLVTRDFAQTVQKPNVPRFIFDCFQRPIQWILSSHDSKRTCDSQFIKDMVIISPYEANMLYSEIEKSKYVTLHLYAPRQNRGYPSLDKLDLYTVSKSLMTLRHPESLRIQLNLFAGQLYLNSHTEYKSLCEFLGVASTKTGDGMTVTADGFITRNDKGLVKKFSKSPLPFLRVLISQIRKDCQDIDKTHLGQILTGRLLDPSDFEDRGLVLRLKRPTPLE